MKEILEMQEKNHTPDSFYHHSISSPTLLLPYSCLTLVQYLPSSYLKKRRDATL